MKRPTLSRIFLFAALLLACGLGAVKLSHHLAAYVERRLNVHASEYKLPQGTLSFPALKPASATEVVDAQGRLLDYLVPGDRIRFYRPLSEIDPKLAQYVVLLEDAKFWGHDGFDLDEIKNSLSKNLESGRFKRGGSTITQQLAKNLFLDKKKSFARKLYEIPWAMRLESDLSKKQILELYLNVIEWGPGIHGAEAAARHYFNRSASSLEPGQAMYLALIVPNPPRFDLYGHPSALAFLEKKKAAFVHRLVGEKKIDPSEKSAYLDAPFGLAPLDRAGRDFPLSHTGNYLGQRNSPKLAWSKSLLRLREELRRAAGGRSRLTLSLDRELQRELEDAPETEAPGQAAHWALVRRDGAVRALRWLEKGKDLEDPSDFDGLESAASVSAREITGN